MYKILQRKSLIIVQRKTLNVVIDCVVLRWPLKCAFVVWFNIYFVKQLMKI